RQDLVALGAADDLAALLDDRGDAVAADADDVTPAAHRRALEVAGTCVHYQAIYCRSRLNTDLGAEHLALRSAVREFAESVVKPVAAEVDRDHRYPAEAIKAAAELDLMGILIPAEYGGAGLDHVSLTICIEEIARACASTAVIVDVHNTVACEPILLFGSDEQKRSWLPAMAAGEVTGAFALTEPSSGSDAAALKTSARRYGDEYVINGSKVFITNIGSAGLYVVFARTG